MSFNGRFYFNPTRFRARMGESAKKKLERLTQKVVDEIIQRSPVLRGNFRASWRVSEGVPIFEAVRSGSEDNPLPPPKITVRASSGYTVMYIANGQIYGQALEKGTSTKAPQGMVRITIAGMR